MSAVRSAKLKPRREPTPRRDLVVALSRKWINDQKRPDLTRLRADAATRWQALVERSPCRIPILDPTSGSAIIAMVACWHGLLQDEITGPGRWPEAIEARYDAMAAIFTNCRINGSVDGRRLKLNEIGRYFSGRDHSTVIHALRLRGLSASGPSPAGTLAERERPSSSPSVAHELPATP